MTYFECHRHVLPAPETRIEAEIVWLATKDEESRTQHRCIGGAGSRRTRFHRKMARKIPRASLPGADGDPVVPGVLQDRPAEPGDVVLRLLHTADWHLGRRFPSFPDEDRKS